MDGERQHASSQHEAAELTRPMLKKRLFVMMRECRQPERVAEHLAAHLRWIIAAERRGVVFASGPFIAPGPPGSAGGMTILRAGTRAEAEAIAVGDPFVAAGIFTFELKEWLLMEGSLTVSISYADGTFRLY